jgi:hypothetical protein
MARDIQMGADNRQGPRRGLDDVDFATMTFNHQRLHGEMAVATTPATPPRPSLKPRTDQSKPDDPRDRHPL